MGPSIDEAALGGSQISSVPRIGMQFNSEQDARSFYNEYGGTIGFSIRIQYSKAIKATGQILSRTYVCSKEGYRKSDKRDQQVQEPTAQTRIGCGARLSIRLDQNIGKYVISNFVESHNHGFVTKKLAHMLPSQRTIIETQATQIVLADESGIPLRLAFELIGRESGGRECVGFLKQDQKNFLRTRRQRMLAFGEVGSILQYFERRYQENPSFFFAIQVDEEEQITNIFWADAHMINDYFTYGDVVAFDTTYKINKENRPFAVFVGLNNHRETIIFASALMYDETADSFSWLFQTFLRAMSNKHPKTIITDQDAAMAKAIAIELPTCFHKLCKWHMTQNALKHANVIFRGPSRVKSVLSPFFEDYEDENEFLVAWDKMLTEYNVQHNTWLQSIFKLRKKWGRPYVRWAWSAGMKSTQLSESFNAALKRYLKSDYHLVLFFHHYDRLLEEKRYQEGKAEFGLEYKLPKVKFNSVKMLVQAGEIYTKAIFEEFQEQYGLSLELEISQKVTRGDDLVVYIVESPECHKRHSVTREKDDSLSCECRLFEMRGVLCNHVIKVLRDVLGSREIPDRYILKRWTRKARSSYIEDSYGGNIEIDPKLDRNERCKSLCRMLCAITDRASETVETSNVLMKNGKEVAELIEKMRHSQVSEKPTGAGGHNLPTKKTIADASATQPKGLKKRPDTGARGRRRIKSFLETKSGTSKRKSHSPMERATSGSISTQAYIPYIPQVNLDFSQPTLSWNGNGQVDGSQMYNGGLPDQQSQVLDNSYGNIGFDLNANECYTPFNFDSFGQNH